MSGMVGELEWDDKLLEVLRSFSGVSMVCARERWYMS
jgi:hypothetical protein